MEPELPPEVTSSILRLAGRPAMARELSTELKYASKLNVLETVCSRPIGKNELEKYIEHDRTFGFVKNVPEDEEQFLRFVEFSVFTLFTPVNILITHITYTIEKDEDDTLHINYNSYHDPDKYNLNIQLRDYDDIILFDLLTIYNILKSRANCMDISADYAYNRTISIFDELIQRWQNIIDYPSLFAYLYINIRVMNLGYYGPEIKLMHVSDENVLKEAMNEIFEPFRPFRDVMDSMIDNIKRYLNAIRNY